MKEKTNAAIIGIITVVSYVSNYFLRNMLSVLTPYIVKTTSYTKEYLAVLSSLYMIAYAAGQLCNGVLGDFIKPKKMVLIGLVVAGAVSALFPLTNYTLLQSACFVLLGYALSMIRGPLMKIISENMKPAYARITCVFFSFSSFAGPLIAGLIAMLFKWEVAFVVAGLLTIFVALFAFVSLTVLENKKIISFKKMKSFGIKDMFGVFKIKGFVFYVIIACLVEIAATSISFWIPTFLNEYIQFSENESNMVFSFISLARAIIPFVALGIYKACGERDILIMKVSYLISIVAFSLTLLVPAGVGTIVFLLIALIMNSLVSALLWSIYIPSLGKTGRVSSANGILDCTGYVAASAATTFFAYMVKAFSWKGLITAWGFIPIIGIVAVFVFEKRLSTEKHV